jgi:hypothetical protein
MYPSFGCVIRSIWRGLAGFEPISARIHTVRQNGVAAKVEFQDIGFQLPPKDLINAMLEASSLPRPAAMT